MLLYWNSGKRDYFRRPIPPYIREAWEFQAVLSGGIAPTGPTFTSERLHERTVWLFSPRVRHGWTGDPRQAASIAVFHFPELPAIVNDIVGDRGWISVPIDRRGLLEVKHLVIIAGRAYKRQDALSELRFRSIMDRLTVLVCAPFAESLALSNRTREEVVVSRAETILGTETERLVPIGELAHRVGTSVATLRRLFAGHRGYAPQRARERIVMEKARRELIRSQFDIVDVALSCGYGSHSAFTKAYHRYWRERPLDTRMHARRSAEQEGIYDR
jgi:AraC-like DNA-binding protein